MSPTDQDPESETINRGCCGCVAVLCFIAAVFGLWLGACCPGAR